MIRKVLLTLVVILLVIQVFRPSLNQSEPTAFSASGDVTKLFPPSPAVKHTLEVACYDCHSNHTNYPWYAHVQPVAWWLERHVRQGKKDLNFSEFAAYSAKRKLKKLEDLTDEVRDHAMPLSSYKWMHRDARLSEDDIRALCTWAESAQDQIAEK
jgi:hypothetical protein